MVLTAYAPKVNAAFERGYCNVNSWLDEKNAVRVWI
jgi:hypothetical protein